MLVVLAAVTFVRHFFVQIRKFRMVMLKFTFLASGSLNWITVQDLRFSYLCCWRLKSSGMWCWAIGWIVQEYGCLTLKMKVPLSFEMSGTTHPAAQHHILEDFNLYCFTTLEYLICKKWKIWVITFPSCSCVYECSNWQDSKLSSGVRKS